MSTHPKYFPGTSRGGGALFMVHNKSTFSRSWPVFFPLLPPGPPLTWEETLTGMETRVAHLWEGLGPALPTGLCLPPFPLPAPLSIPNPLPMGMGHPSWMLQGTGTWPRRGCRSKVGEQQCLPDSVLWGGNLGCSPLCPSPTFLGPVPTLDLGFRGP